MSPYDHPEWHAFVAAVRESPDDDTPRLVAADWLEERGEAARAELIRAQCELARIDPFGISDRRNQLQTAVSRLLGGPNPRLIADQVAATFERGFAERLSLPAPAWLRHADELLRRECVRVVVLTTHVRFHRGPKVGLVMTDDPLLVEFRAIDVRLLGGSIDPTANRYRRDGLGLLGSRWPGVRFELPTHNEVPPAEPPGALGFVTIGNTTMPVGQWSTAQAG